MTRTVLVATDDGRDAAYARMRAPAIRWAADAGARVVLYDRSAESYFVDPYPSGPWTADVESGPQRRSVLEPRDLELLGRHYLAEQVTEARATGADVAAWLPSTPGPKGMAEAVDACEADTIILPSSIERPSLVDRVSGNTLDRIRKALTVSIAIGDQDGVRTVGDGSGD